MNSAFKKIVLRFCTFDLRTPIFLAFMLFVSAPIQADDKFVVNDQDGNPSFTVMDAGTIQTRTLSGTQSDNTLAKIGGYVSVSDEYGETLLIGGAYNRLNFLDKEGGSVDFSPSPTSGNVSNLFNGKGSYIYWLNPSGDIVITIDLPGDDGFMYMREIIIQFVYQAYPTSFLIEYYKDDGWVIFDDVTNWNSNLYAKKTGSALYNTTKLRLTMREYNNPNYIHIDEIIWTYYRLPMHNAYVHREGEQNVYGGLNLAVESGKVGIGTRSPDYLLELDGGAYSDGTQWIDGSSRAYKENIKDLTTDDALATLRDLIPVTFNYKGDRSDNAVGFIAEDVPELVATKDRRGLSPMEIVAVLSKVVKEQQIIIEQLSNKMSRLEKQMKIE